MSFVVGDVCYCLCWRCWCVLTVAVVGAAAAVDAVGVCCCML